jgi:hypothetical protein
MHQLNMWDTLPLVELVKPEVTEQIREIKSDLSHARLVSVKDFRSLEIPQINLKEYHAELDSRAVLAICVEPIILPSGKIAVSMYCIVDITNSRNTFWIRQYGALLYTFRSDDPLWQHFILDRMYT